VGEEGHEPGHAARQAALAAGWSHRHRDVSGGWLRPTVFGAVDGLVTNTSLAAALGVAAVALLTGAMVVGRLTGRPLLRSGLRQLALGALAVGVTFAVGSLIGGGHAA
jgi:VIT1/CCC1 family predicted Fe2+/Mn2+ transporter